MKEVIIKYTIPQQEHEVILYLDDDCDDYDYDISVLDIEFEGDVISEIIVDDD